jgi:hypothetical protein
MYKEIIRNLYIFCVETQYYLPQHLRGLVDTGSEINLISEATVTLIGFTRRESKRHTRVSPELKERPTAPIILRHHVLATLSDPNSDWSFKDVHLKIGPICGD